MEAEQHRQQDADKVARKAERRTEEIEFQVSALVNALEDSKFCVRFFVSELLERLFSSVRVLFVYDSTMWLVKVTLQMEEERKNVARLTDLIEKLQSKLRVYKRQIDETVS